LGPYFHTTDLDVQRRKLTEMIGEALGGPEAPWLLGLRTRIAVAVCRTATSALWPRT